jgi:hypothetical protein
VLCREREREKERERKRGEGERERSCGMRFGNSATFVVVTGATRPNHRSALSRFRDPKRQRREKIIDNQQVTRYH